MVAINWLASKYRIMERRLAVLESLLAHPFAAHPGTCMHEDMLLPPNHQLHEFVPQEDGVWLGNLPHSDRNAELNSFQVLTQMSTTHQPDCVTTQKEAPTRKARAVKAPGVPHKLTEISSYTQHGLTTTRQKMPLTSSASLPLQSEPFDRCTYPEASEEEYQRDGEQLKRCGDADPWRCASLGQFKLGGKLGVGSFGQVRVITKKGTGQPLVAKIVDMKLNVSDKTDPKCPAVVEAEADCWSTVGAHRNCVELFDTMFFGPLCFLFMECCQSSLMDDLESMISAKHADLIDLFYQMLLGIGHCHSRKVVHRDIKPDNFLCGGDDGKTVKLCDFSLAAVMPAKGKLTGVYGTAPFMSPEMVGNSGHDFSTDIWSFGATAYLLVYAEFPYMPEEMTVTCMNEAIVADSPKPRYSPSGNAFQPPALFLTQVIRSCLTRQAKLRVGMDELLKNDFFTEKGAKRVAGVDKFGHRLEMQRVIRKARMHMMDFKRKVDPTIQQDFDELLELLFEAPKMHCPDEEEDEEDDSEFMHTR